MSEVARNSIELTGVQETLLTPLCGRADQFGRPDAIVTDPLAHQLVESIHYDFSKLRRFHDTLVGAAIRAAIFDRWIGEFLSVAEQPTVVMLAEGLDTTMARNDDGRANWFEIDFPDVITLRDRLMPATERQHRIAGSVLEPDWIAAVKAAGGRGHLFQAAGLTMYLTADQVRGLMTMLADHFPGCTFLFDTCSVMAKNQSHRWEATVRTTTAKYQFGIDDPATIRDWDPRFEVRRSESMMDHHRHQWRLRTRIVSALWPGLRHAYRLNESVLG